MKVVNIATQPHRAESLARTVNSLLPQCDHINIYANGYDPKFKNKKITVHSGEDLGASGKFYSLGKVKGYYFTCDDDIIYPKDYIGYLSHMIDLYKRQAVIGVHATIYNRFPIKSYYKDQKVFYLEQGNSEDRFVHMLGTGTLGFHTDTLPGLRLKDFHEKNMCDPVFSKYCIENSVPQISLTRASGWMNLQAAASDSKAIWKSAASDGSKQTAIINSIKNFRLVTVPKINRKVFGDASLEEKAVIEIFKILKEGTVLELGSGSVTGELSKHYKMVSIEHDKKFLNKHNSRYIHAPIKDGFYDLDNVEIPEYDLLLIDGPNSMFTDFKKQIGRKQFRSYFMRYESKFDLTKPILVDDVDREDERILMNALAARTGREPKIFQGKRKQFAII